MNNNLNKSANANAKTRKAKDMNDNKNMILLIRNIIRNIRRITSIRTTHTEEGRAAATSVFRGIRLSRAVACVPASSWGVASS